MESFICTWSSEDRPNGANCEVCHIAIRSELGPSCMRLRSEGGARQLQLGQETKGARLIRDRPGPLPSRCHVVVTLSAGACGVSIPSTSPGRRPHGGGRSISFWNAWPSTNINTCNKGRGNSRAITSGVAYHNRGESYKLRPQPDHPPITMLLPRLRAPTICIANAMAER